MENKSIDPRYMIISENGIYGIEGKENSSGETVRISKISGDMKRVMELAEVLNKNKVSVLHAKDVIRDMALVFINDI